MPPKGKGTAITKREEKEEQLNYYRLIFTGQAQVSPEGDAWGLIESTLGAEDAFAENEVISAEAYIGQPFTLRSITLRPSEYFNADEPVGFNNFPVYVSLEGVNPDGEAIVVNSSSARVCSQAVTAKLNGQLPTSEPVVIATAKAKQGQNPPQRLVWAKDYKPSDE